MTRGKKCPSEMVNRLAPIDEDGTCQLYDSRSCPNTCSYSSPLVARILPREQSILREPLVTSSGAMKRYSPN